MVGKQGKCGIRIWAAMAVLYKDQLLVDCYEADMQPCWPDISPALLTTKRWAPLSSKSAFQHMTTIALYSPSETDAF